MEFYLFFWQLLKVSEIEENVTCDVIVPVTMSPDWTRRGEMMGSLVLFCFVSSGFKQPDLIYCYVAAIKSVLVQV